MWLHKFHPPCILPAHSPPTHTHTNPCYSVRVRKRERGGTAKVFYLTTSIANTAIVVHETWIWGTGVVISTGVDRSTRRKTCPIVSLIEDKHRVTNSDGEGNWVLGCNEQCVIWYLQISVGDERDSSWWRFFSRSERHWAVIYKWR
jgi:hypothetical protein